MRRTAGFFALVAVVAPGPIAVAVTSSRSAGTPVTAAKPLQFSASDFDYVQHLVGYHIPQPRDSSGWRLKEILVFPQYLQRPDSLPPFAGADNSSGPICTPDVNLCLALHYTSDTSGDVLVNVHLRVQNFPRPRPPLSSSSPTVEMHDETLTVEKSPAQLEATTIFDDRHRPIVTSAFIQWRLGKVPLAAAAAIKPENVPPGSTDPTLPSRQQLLAFLGSFQ